MAENSSELIDGNFWIKREFDRISTDVKELGTRIQDLNKQIAINLTFTEKITYAEKKLVNLEETLSKFSERGERTSTEVARIQTKIGIASAVVSGSVALMVAIGMKLLGV